jgi:hypothetical protein
MHSGMIAPSSFIFCHDARNPMMLGFPSWPT